MGNQREIKEQLYSLETTLLKGEVRKSEKILNELLAEDFVEYSSTGEIYDKDNILNRLPSEDDPGIIMSNFEIKYLSPTSVLTTFKIFIESKQKHSLRSSVWKYNDEKWQMVFHQGTVTDQ
ncbi:nuclear transport factor 2 family protein [Halobacillus sp. K22]|uniref:nuclear transport factor 2 family protein n=1 Tax=Halobacillus sp. K22 TaxID=3457431 RepID=UPI003FCC3F82